MTAGRTKTDMHWVRAELGAVRDHHLYLVMIDCGRPARDMQIMAGRTVRVSLEAIKAAGKEGVLRQYRPVWMARITKPDERAA